MSTIKNTQTIISCKRLMNKIWNDLNNYLNFNRMSDEEIFNKEIFNYDINTSNWNPNWVYYHLKIKSLKTIKQDADFRNYVNGQIIEYYIIKNIPDSITKWNKEITDIEEYAEKNWYNKSFVNRNWNAKTIYIKYNDDNYLQVLFHQNGI